MLNAIFLFFLTVATVVFFYVATKNTLLRLDLRSGRIWPILLYREFFMVFSGILLASAYGVGAFEGAILNARDDDIFTTSLWSIYAVLAFGATLAFLVRYFDISSDIKEYHLIVNDHKVRRFANAAILIGVSLSIFSFLFLSYNHAFIASILTGEGLVAVRLRNSYGSRLPSQIAQVITISWWIISIYVGILLYQRRRLRGAFYGLISLFLASTAGDKAPVVMCFMLISFSYFSLRGVKISGRWALKVVLLYFPVLYIALFLIVSLQIPELTVEKFNVYLLNRLGVGQMAGVFETFSIPRLDGDFFWHMIPGASFFVEYIPYDKMLMMIVEGYGYTEMGVKNSLFISEAYGMGGMPLVIFAPAIVGISYALGILILYLFLYRFFGRPIALIYALPLYILSSALTGGFSSFPLFKGLILEILCLGVIWLGFQFLRLSLKKRSNRNNVFPGPHHLPRPVPGPFPRAADPRAARSGHPGVGTGPQL